MHRTKARAEGKEIDVARCNVIRGNDKSCSLDSSYFGTLSTIFDCYQVWIVRCEMIACVFNRLCHHGRKLPRSGRKNSLSMIIETVSLLCCPPFGGERERDRDLRKKTWWWTGDGHFSRTRGAWNYATSSRYRDANYSWNPISSAIGRVID